MAKITAEQVLKDYFVGKRFRPPADQHSKAMYKNPTMGKWQPIHEIVEVKVFAEGGGTCDHNHSEPHPYLYLYHAIEGRNGLFGKSYDFDEKVEIVP